MNSILLIGYSGHAYVICDIFESIGRKVVGYCENEYKDYDPFELTYHGRELSKEGLAALKANDYFIAIGSGKIREIIQSKLTEKGVKAPTNALHTSAVIAASVQLGKGVMVAARATINPLAIIGDNVICNTGCVIEHENRIGDYSHVGPGAVLCGNVWIGRQSFIGANAVVKQGIKIGNNVTIGAGAVIIKDVPDNTVVVGNPQRVIRTV
ncbi:MAG: acetyltransferase [Bacteroidota bacterium]